MIAQDKSTPAATVASAPPLVQSSASIPKTAPVGVEKQEVAALSPMQLLTPEEALLPAAKKSGFVRQPDNDGPEIVIDPELTGKEIGREHSLKILFTPRDAAVDPSSLKFELLKSPVIDLTERVWPYTAKNGISIEKIKLPPGRYQFRIQISDVNGRLSEKDFTILVSGKF